MEKDPTFKLHVIPVWFSKKCRETLKGMFENSKGQPEAIIQRLLERLELRQIWDHAGTITRGKAQHLIMMPYGPLDHEKVVEFAKLIGANLVSTAGERGFWGPDSYYFEFAPS